MRSLCVVVLGLLVPEYSSGFAAETASTTRFALWDEDVPFPGREELRYPDGAKDVMVFCSRDCGRTWSPPSENNFPMEGSKIYAGPEWSYPCTIEVEGKLYFVYTSEKHHCVLTAIPVKSLGRSCREDDSFQSAT